MSLRMLLRFNRPGRTPLHIFVPLFLLSVQPIILYPLNRALKSPHLQSIPSGVPCHLQLRMLLQYLCHLQICHLCLASRQKAFRQVICLLYQLSHPSLRLHLTFRHHLPILFLQRLHPNRLTHLVRPRVLTRLWAMIFQH